MKKCTTARAGGGELGRVASRIGWIERNDALIDLEQKRVVSQGRGVESRESGVGGRGGGDGQTDGEARRGIVRVGKRERTK